MNSSPTRSSSGRDRNSQDPKKIIIEIHRVEPSVEAFAELHLGVSSITLAAVQHILFHTDLMQMQHREQWTCWIEPLIFFDAFFPMRWH